MINFAVPSATKFTDFFGIGPPDYYDNIAWEHPMREFLIEAGTTWRRMSHESYKEWIVVSIEIPDEDEILLRLTHGDLHYIFDELIENWKPVTRCAHSDTLWSIEIAPGLFKVVGDEFES